MMKNTQRWLMALFCTSLLAAALLYMCGDFLDADLTIWPSASRSCQFFSSTAMILLTVGLLPLSLRLFKFRLVSADLQARKARALARWGTLRLLVMGVLLVANVFLYYAFGFESTYGYLAVVTLLCMPFVVPTMNRCLAEVAPQEETPTACGEAAAEENDADNDEEVNHSHSQL